MAVWTWILQVIVLLVVWKLIHLLFWNVRKVIGSGSLLLTMGITLIIAVIAVLVAHIWHTDWSQVIALAVLLGIAGGEYEYSRSADK